MSRRRRFEMHGYDYIERSVTLMCFLCVAGGMWVAVGGLPRSYRGPRGYCPADPPAHPRFPFLSSIVSECAVCFRIHRRCLSHLLPSYVNLDAICVDFCGILKCHSRTVFFLLTDVFFLFLTIPFSFVR